jgi:hypothetical protein
MLIREAETFRMCRFEKSFALMPTNGLTECGFTKFEIEPCSARFDWAERVILA